jgi:hypothetical protein
MIPALWFLHHGTKTENQTRFLAVVENGEMPHTHPPSLKLKQQSGLPPFPFSWFSFLCLAITGFACINDQRWGLKPISRELSKE